MKKRDIFSDRYTGSGSLPRRQAGCLNCFLAGTLVAPQRAATALACGPSLVLTSFGHRARSGSSDMPSLENSQATHCIRDVSFQIVRKKIKKATTLVLLCCFVLVGCQDKKMYKDTRVLMGTFVTVTSPFAGAKEIVFAEIKRISDSLSKYKTDSEISILNRTGKLSVSPDTYYIIKKAKQFWLSSDGAFDITIGPLVDLWGFTDKKYRVPSDEEIKNTLPKVGLDKIILNDSDNLVEFKVPGMKIDLGAIAKGYAVDSAVKKLKEKGVKSCLINAGGQIHCLGDNYGRPWTVGVKNPKGKGILRYLKLKDMAVATSGDYEQCFINTKKRYAHLFNPETGYPAESGVISVTIIASEGLTCDALSTASFVLGKKGAEDLIKKFPGVSAIILEEKKAK